MKKLTLLFFICVSALAKSQVCYDAAVLVNATVNESPANISLTWPLYPAATSFTVYRKKLGTTNWNAPVASLAGTATGYSDSNILIDSLYEYKVLKVENGANAYGYIVSGIKMKADDTHGYIIMLVDSNVADSISTEVHQLMKDLSGDGWAILRHDVSRNASVTSIKSLVVSDYNAYPNVNSVIIVGHVPVPYSGDLNPDGHPDHLGAWPADVYYGELDGTWTDNAVNDTLAGRIENRNKIGDGKFDQTFIPTNVELQVGRIDFNNMPSFPQSEIQLLKQYFQKDHAFKTKQFTPVHRGLIDDNFGYFSGEAFAASGWRSMAPLVGNSNVSNQDFFTTLHDSSYLWSYGCGGGWFQGAGGVGATTDFVNDTVKTVFTELFGSYFGDWDSQDNFLRAPLAGKTQALSCVWSGRPYWQFHPMAMGKTLGYCTQLTQNNSNTYFGNYAQHWVHIALMGDPSLRQDMITPPSDLQVDSLDISNVMISWTSSPDSVLGYYVYRSNEEFGVYQRITPTIVINNSFVDSSPQFGNNFYQVRAVKLQHGFSGTYYNTSLGIGDSAAVFINGVNELANQTEIKIWPNPNQGNFQMQLNDKTGLVETVSVYNLQGQLMFQNNFISSTSIQSFNLQTLPAGIYMLRISNENESRLQKLIITK